MTLPDEDDVQPPGFADAVLLVVPRGSASAAMDAEAATPYLMRLLGVTEGTAGLDGLDPEAIRLRTLDILREMALRGSRQGVLVFAIEDLHWSAAQLEGIRPEDPVRLGDGHLPERAPGQGVGLPAGPAAAAAKDRGRELIADREHMPSFIARCLHGEPAAVPVELAGVGRALPVGPG